MKLAGVFPDNQKVLIKTKYEEKLVAYKEVRLGIHDPAIPQKVCDEAFLRMGSEREATVYQIQKEHKADYNKKRREAAKKKA